MTMSRLKGTLRRLSWTELQCDRRGMSDVQLLQQFASLRDPLAFEALVRFHGPMVLGVCRRVLHNHHDAEDAFQATFLVLSRKAASIVPRERIGDWLYGVAYRSALKLKSLTAKRRMREKQVTEFPEPSTASPDNWRELESVLDAELSRLPANYREPIVLCDLEGKTHAEAARQLGWP